MKVHLALAADGFTSDEGAVDSETELAFHSVVKSTTPTNSPAQESGCGGCFYCDQEMPQCCEGVIGGADPRDPLPRQRRRPASLGRPAFPAAPRLLTVTWARRTLSTKTVR